MQVFILRYRQNKPNARRGAFGLQVTAIFRGLKTESAKGLCILPFSIYSAYITIYGKGQLCHPAREIFAEDFSASAYILFKGFVIGQRRGSGGKQIVYMLFFIEPLGIFKAAVFLKALSEEFFGCIQIPLREMFVLIE